MDAPIIVIIICASLIVYTGYRIWKLIDLSRRASAGKGWPAISGDVISKYIDESTDNESGTSYYPKVKYKYSVMGQEYEKEITLHGIFNRRRSEKALAQIGDTVEVRYNPEKPEEDVTGHEKITLGDILIITGLVVLIFIILFAVFS